MFEKHAHKTLDPSVNPTIHTVVAIIKRHQDTRLLRGHDRTMTMSPGTERVTTAVAVKEDPSIPRPAAVPISTGKLLAAPV